MGKFFGSGPATGPSQGIFNPPSDNASPLFSSSQLPPINGASALPCTFDQDQSFEFLDVRSRIFNPAPIAAYVCLQTTPQDEVWEVFHACAYYNNNPAFGAGSTNANPALFLINKNQVPPTANDDPFFPGEGATGVANTGVPINTIPISTNIPGDSANIAIGNENMLNIMPRNTKSFLIPPGFTLMLWDGNFTCNPDHAPRQIGLRVVILRKKYNTVAAVVYGG